jgi:hypothetical protein
LIFVFLSTVLNYNTNKYNNEITADKKVILEILLVVVITKLLILIGNKCFDKYTLKNFKYLTVNKIKILIN